MCCVAHTRRKFAAESDAGDGRAAKALEIIGRLYAVERALRQRDAEPVWDEWPKWLNAYCCSFCGLWHVGGSSPKQWTIKR